MKTQFYAPVHCPVTSVTNVTPVLLGVQKIVNLVTLGLSVKQKKTNPNLHAGCEPDLRLSTAAEENIQMASLITRGSVFAVVCQDNDYEYY